MLPKRIGHNVGLSLQDIQTRTSDSASSECVEQGSLIYDIASGGVDKHSTMLYSLEAFTTNQARRCLREWDVNGHEVCLLEQIIQAYSCNRIRPVLQLRI